MFSIVAAALLMCAVLSTLYALRTLGRYSGGDQPPVVAAVFLSLLLWLMLSAGGANIEFVDTGLNHTGDGTLVYGSTGMVLFNVVMLVYVMALVAVKT